MRVKLLAYLSIVVAFVALKVAPAEAITTTYSSNWAAEVLAPAAGNLGAYEGVYAEFDLPHPNAGKCGGSRLNPLMPWVGLGGDTSPGGQLYPFTQAGWFWDYNWGWRPWFQFFHADGSHTPIWFVNDFPGTYTNGDPGVAGDHVSTRVVWGAGHQHLWLVWHDFTNGKKVVREFPDSNGTPTWGTNHTAEFVVEDNSHSSRNLPWFGDFWWQSSHAEQVDGSKGDDANGVPIATRTWSVSNADEREVLQKPGYRDRVYPYLQPNDGYWHAHQINC